MHATSHSCVALWSIMLLTSSASPTMEPTPDPTPWSQCTTCTHSKECKALVALYQSAMDGGTDVTAYPGWGSGCPDYNWEGVSLDYTSGKVASLYYAGTPFDFKSLPTELGDLTSLTSIYILQASCSGTIPTELGSLKNATTLFLQSNLLSGTLPSELGSMTSLTSIDTQKNSFSTSQGGVPSELSRLAYDKNFDDTSFAPGVLDPATYSALTTLYKSAMIPFHGSGGLCTDPVYNCVGFVSADNWLDPAAGTSPCTASWSSVWCSIIRDVDNEQQVKTVTSLPMSVATLVGTLPTQIGLLSNVGYDAINGNGFQFMPHGSHKADSGLDGLTTSVPTEIGLLTLMTELNLGTNELDKGIPTEIARLSLLKGVSLQGNKFSNKLPTEIATLTGITSLSVQQNSLTGGLPSEIGLMNETTQGMQFYDNSLECGLPTEIARLQYDFYRSTVDGANVVMPQGLSMPCEPYRALSALYASQIKPPQYSYSYTDDTAKLFRNWMIGQNPCTQSWYGVLCSSGSDTDNRYRYNGVVQFQSISSQDMTGTLPTEFGYLTGVTGTLLFEECAQSGTLPTELAQMSGLEALGFVDENYHGSLPTQLGKLTSLTQLQITAKSYAGFSCGVPTQLGNLAYDNLISDGVDNYIPGAVSCGTYTALSRLYHSGGNFYGIYGENGASNWLRMNDVCNYRNDGMESQWNGVTCGLVNSTTEGGKRMVSWEVTDLASMSGGMTGTLPTQVGLLSALTSDFELASNFMTAPLPTEVGKMTSLAGLLSLESLGWVTTPETVDQRIPSEIGGLSALGALRISSSIITSTVPTELGSLSGALCSNLDLSGNAMTGSLPTQLGQLSCLSVGFDLSGNSFVGSIPTMLGLGKLETGFDLSSNLLQHAIPTQLGKHTSLQTTFSLEGNSFDGTIPTQLGEMTGLTSGFVLRDNAMITGSIPTELFRLSGMESNLRLSDTGLSTTIPTEFGTFLSMSNIFDISNAGFVGSVPTELGHWNTFYETFLASNNKLSNTLPTELGKLMMVREFQAFDNSFTGAVPTQLGSWIYMNYDLKVYSNRLTARIPTQIGKWTAVSTQMQFYMNSMTGPIPTELGIWSRMTSQFDFSINSLSSEIPTQLGLLVDMSETMYLSTNMFTGTLPTELGRMTKLANRLYLSSNSIGSAVPTEFGKMTGLVELLNFDGNEFCADVPSEIAALDARFVTYVSTSVGTPCDACGVGAYYFTDTSARDPVTNEYVTSCPNCPAGKFQDDAFFGGTSCSDCPVGKYSAEAASSCLICAAGSHTAGQAGAGVCTGCPVGTFLEDSATTASLHRNESQCELCEAGKAAAQTGSGSCSECGAGKYMEATGASSCTVCKAGKLMSSTGASACINCDTAKYSGSGALACIECPGNTDATEGSPWCTKCKDGFIKDDRPSKAPAGHALHNTTCIECSVDEIGDVFSLDPEKSAISCTFNESSLGARDKKFGAVLSELEILPGWWRPSQYTFKDIKRDGLRKCPYGATACPGNTVFSNGGDSYCAEGYTGPLCSLCADMYTFDSQNLACIPCDTPTGGVSPSPALVVLGLLVLLLLAAGVFYIRKRMKVANMGFVDVFTAAFDAAQKGEDAIIEEAVEEYAHKDDDGNAPGEANWKVRLLRLKKSLAVKSKILLTFFQIVTTVGFNLSLEFPANYTNFTNALGFVNLDVLSVVPFGCIGPGTNFYSTLVFMTMVPIIAFALLVSLSKATGKGVFFSAALTLCFFVLPSSSTAIFQSLKCAPFTDIDVSYMEVDYSIVCAKGGEMSSNRIFWVMYASIMVFIFPIGIPFLFFVSLWEQRYKLCPPMREIGSETTFSVQNDGEIASNASLSKGDVAESKTERKDGEEISSGKGEKKEPNANAPEATGEPSFGQNFDNQGIAYIFFHNEHWSHFTADDISEEDKLATAHLSFLTQAYEPHMFWFEVFECFRRLMLSSMLVMIEPGTPAQIVVAILVCLLGIKFYSYYEPFVESSDDHMAEAAQWQTFCVFFSALLLKLNATEESPSQEAMLGFFIVFIVALGFVIMGGMTGFEMYLEYAGHLEEAAEWEEEDEETIIEADAELLDADGKPKDKSEEGNLEENKEFFSVVADFFNGDDTSSNGAASSKPADRFEGREKVGEDKEFFSVVADFFSAGDTSMNEKAVRKL